MSKCIAGLKTNPGKKCNNRVLIGSPFCRRHRNMIGGNGSGPPIFKIYVTSDSKISAEKLKKLKELIGGVYEIIKVEQLNLDDMGNLGMWFHLKDRYPNLKESNVIVFTLRTPPGATNDDAGLTLLEYGMRDYLKDVGAQDIVSLIEHAPKKKFTGHEMRDLFLPEPVAGYGLYDGFTMSFGLHAK